MTARSHSRMRQTRRGKTFLNRRGDRGALTPAKMRRLLGKGVRQTTDSPVPTDCTRCRLGVPHGSPLPPRV